MYIKKVFALYDRKLNLLNLSASSRVRSGKVNYFCRFSLNQTFIKVKISNLHVSKLHYGF